MLVDTIKISIILLLTIIFLISELVINQIIASTILLVNCYQTLVNLLIVIEYFTRQTDFQIKIINRENTFGWTRIHTISNVITTIFLISLNFSLILDTIQEQFHVEYVINKKIDSPLFLLIIGVLGLLLNSLTFCLIGGYQFQQQRRNKLANFLKDITNCCFIIVQVLVIYYMDDLSDYIDLVLTIASSMILIISSFPTLIDSCLILLQTIPKSINCDDLQKDLIRSFPSIINIHDLYVWQLTIDEIVLTMHTIVDHRFDESVLKGIETFLKKYGIVQITIQPEFAQQNVDKQFCCNLR